MIVGCTALQLTSDVLGICGKEMIAYEAITPNFPGVCSVFCVPEGACEGQVQMGKMNYLGITAQGNCKHKGFTESAALGNLTQQTVEWLKHLQGPCKGMKLLKFKKPAVVEQKMAPEQAVCGKEQKAYESISTAYPGVCSVFCVPEGQCNGRVIAGQMNYLGITGEGNCLRKGYTQRAQFSNVTKSMVEWLKTFQGSCKGITLTKFQKPGAPAKKDDKFCGNGQTAYESISASNPGMCSVICVPGGDCEGQVQMGRMKYLSIIGQGTCIERGYKDRMLFETEWVKNLTGPCRGMDIVNFQKPPLVVEKSVSEE